MKKAIIIGSNGQNASYLDFQFTKIEEGIRETVEWFVSNYENSRK